MLPLQLQDHQSLSFYHEIPISHTHEILTCPSLYLHQSMGNHGHGDYEHGRDHVHECAHGDVSSHVRDENGGHENVRGCDYVHDRGHGVQGFGNELPGAYEL